MRKLALVLVGPLLLGLSGLLVSAAILTR